MNCHPVRILLMLILVSLCACTSGEDKERSEEIDKLRSDIEELKLMKYRLSTLESEVASLRKSEQAGGDKSSDAPIQAKSAPILVMTFSDFQCRPCREFYNDSFPKLVEEFADTNRVWFVYRDFPLSSNPHAARAAQAAHCAGEQGLYWEMFNLLFENQAELDKGNLEYFPKQLNQLRKTAYSKCMNSTRYDKEIRKDVAEGRTLGAKGVPAFFIGYRADDSRFEGALVRGAQPYAVLRDQILRIEKRSKGADATGDGTSEKNN